MTGPIRALKPFDWRQGLRLAAEAPSIDDGSARVGCEFFDSRRDGSRGLEFFDLQRESSSQLEIIQFATDAADRTGNTSAEAGVGPARASTANIRATAA
jgi:hypothetical protein